MYQGNSLLLDFFTEHYGKIRLIARGARSKKTSLQMFQGLKISYTGKGDLQSLTQWESNDEPRRLMGDDLIIEQQGFFANADGKISGDILLNIANANENCPSTEQLSILKILNRKRLKLLLGEKPLKSRELFFVN